MTPRGVRANARTGCDEPFAVSWRALGRADPQESACGGPRRRPLLNRNPRRRSSRGFRAEGFSCNMSSNAAPPRRAAFPRVARGRTAKRSVSTSARSTATTKGSTSSRSSAPRDNIPAIQRARRRRLRERSSSSFDHRQDFQPSRRPCAKLLGRLWAHRIHGVRDHETGAGAPPFVDTCRYDKNLPQLEEAKGASRAQTGDRSVVRDAPFF